MKKVVFLWFSLTLLCLCACQAWKAERSIPEKRIPPDRQLTLEEALEYATPVCGPDLIDEILEDMDLTKKMYEGYYFLFNVYVRENLPFCDYIKVTYQTDYRSKGVAFLIHLPQDERESLQTLDVVKLVGKVSSIEPQSNGMIYVEITDAHCVTRTFQITARLLEDFHGWDGSHYLILKDENDTILPNSEIMIPLEEEVDYEEGSTVTITGSLRYGKMVRYIEPFTYLFCMDEPESIEKE